MIDRKFFLGFVRIHILHHAAQEHVYGVWLMDELRRHGYDMSPGTLYPILHELEKDGFLKSDKRVVGGKVRRYYIITSKGREGMGKNAQLSINHFGLSATEDIEMDSNNDVTLGLEDSTPPFITDVSYTPTAFMLKKSLSVRARVEDTGIRSLASVQISYRVNGGGWHNVTMVETEPGVYQGTIPKQNLVDLEFKVVAVDQMGNVQVSSTQTVDVGGEESLVLLVITIVFIIVIIVVIAIALKNRSTVSRYLKNQYNRDRYPNLSKPEDEKK